MMKTYEKYKPSGFEFIGDIPTHWSTKRLKFLVSEKLKYGANESAELEDLDQPRYIRITDFGEDGTLRENTFKSLPFEVAKHYFLENGDILFARSGATVGKTFQFKNYDGLACYAGYLIKANPDENQITSDFLYYFTKSNSYESWKDSIFIQATIQNIGADKYNVLEIPLPTLPEQAAIADYLDEKTAEIDKLIANKKRLIELLKEERAAVINVAVTRGVSGVIDNGQLTIDNENQLSIDNYQLSIKDDWLGDIPEHWEVKKLKFLGSCQNGVSEGSDYFGSGFPFVSYGDVYKNAVLPSNVEGLANSSTNDRKRFSVKKGDIFFTRTSETIEEIGIASTCLKTIENATFSGFLIRFRPEKGIFDSHFAKYYFRSQIQRVFFVKEMNLVTRASLSQDLLTRLPALLPSISEQKEIATFLDDKTNEIDSTISKIEKEIELIKEYRTALISEVVTGKIKVTDN